MNDEARMTKFCHSDLDIHSSFELRISSFRGCSRGKLLLSCRGRLAIRPPSSAVRACAQDRLWSAMQSCSDDFPLYSTREGLTTMVRRWFTLGCLLLAGASPGCGICQN